MAELIDRARIRRDGGTQPRAALNQQTVADYVEAHGAGAVFPPVTVFFDGTDYWLADGFHRDAMHEALGLLQMACEVRAGTRREAVLFAVGANEAHGLRRTNEDKRRAVLILLDDPEWGHWSDREIAARCRVSHPFVARLRPVTGNVSSERTFTTKHGTVSTMDAAAIGKRQADYATLRAADPAALYRVVKEDRDARQAAKAQKREAREQDLGASIAAGNAALDSMAAEGRRFGVILADPEWRFEPWSRESGMDRAPENHYPTTPTRVIASRPVGALAAPDCVLFLWATAPMLYAAHDVITGWGFTYRTHCVWLKRRPGQARGPGYWFTGEHEILLLATKGSPPAPAPGQQWRSAFVAPVGVHSEKPDRAYELIESYFPSLPKLELNARKRRPGWEAWGAEAPEGGGAPSPSWSGSSRPSTSCPAEDVDARHKGEHDGGAMGGPRPEEADDLPDAAPPIELPALPMRAGRAS